MIDFTRKLARIADVSAQVGQEREGVAKIVEETSGIFGASMAAAFRVEQGSNPKYIAGLGIPNRAVRQLEDAASSAWITDLLNGRDGRDGPVVIHADNDPSGQGTGVWVEALKVETIAVAPLHSDGRMIGVLVVSHAVPHDYRPQEKDALHIIAVLTQGIVARLPQDEGETRESYKSQLFSVLSHELRTPLTSIMGFTQLLRKRLSASGHADARTMEQLDVLWAQAHRLNRLIDTFVDMARIERGEFEITRGKVEIISLLKSAVEQATSQANSHHLTRLDLPDETLWLHGDSKRLEQVFNNVISNAVRYSPQSQPIIISCKEDQSLHTVTIKISDRGPGIPGARLKEVFERNYPSGPLKSGGLGVGLYLSKVIVEAHGGQISVGSLTGEGTTVTIVLPV